MFTTPIYTLDIPSTKKQFKFRPFLVKDEKALLIAHQSEDVSIMMDTVKDLIQACSKSNIDVSKLASFDIEYMFLQMRARSTGEFVDLVFTCDIDHGEDNPKARVIKQINLLDARVEFFDGHTNKIPLFENVGVVMKYPTLETLKKLETPIEDNEVDKAIDIIADCVDFIYDDKEVFPAHEQRRDDLIQFFNNLQKPQLDLIKNFFQTMPQLRVYVDYECPVCARKHKKYMEGLASFF